MKDRNPEKNFEELWKVFESRYPFFSLREVDWQKQYQNFRPRVSKETNDDDLFEIISEMVAPLNDAHVEIKRKNANNGNTYFNSEEKPYFWQEFSDEEIEKIFNLAERNLLENGFGKVSSTPAWMLKYCRSEFLGYIRILELEDVKKKELRRALDHISQDFSKLSGFIVDIRDCPGGDDSTAIEIINRFCDRKRVAFHRQTKIGPGHEQFTPLKTWYIRPEGDVQFTRPIVVLTCDSVFSGGEVFALAIRELPHVTIIGDNTNGIFSYQLEKRLPNGWEYCLSYQVYLSADMICYEGRGVPPDIFIRNSKADLRSGADPLIIRALDFLRSAGST